MVAKHGLNPHFPVVTGRHQLTAEWSIDLPGEFNRRIDDGDLVFWRPGITAFVAIWNNDNAESIGARLAWLRGDMNPEAFDIVQEDLVDAQRFAYRLREDSEDSEENSMPALYAFTVVEDSHLQLAVYFDDEHDVEVALRLWRSVAFAQNDPLRTPRLH